MHDRTSGEQNNDEGHGLHRPSCRQCVTVQVLAPCDEAYTFYSLLRFCLASFAKGVPFELKPVSLVKEERAMLLSQAEHGLNDLSSPPSRVARNIRLKRYLLNHCSHGREVRDDGEMVRKERRRRTRLGQ